MPSEKTLAQREKELQTLLATMEGQIELAALAARYQAAGGRPRAERSSVITYILIHERLNGMLVG
ncbi:MAG: hypothetical protein ACJ8F7_14690 [Gemmataceae bacterium]